MNSSTPDVLHLAVSDFLDRLGERTPTPGGGSVAALSGALCCAMARMVAAYSDRGGDQVAPITERLAKADRILRRLITEDIAAYERLSAANRAARADATAAGTRQEALVTAAVVPLEMAAAAVAALAAMDELKSMSSKYLISDLGVAATLGRACAEAAAYSVRVNLADMADPTAPDRPAVLAAEIRRLLADAERLALSVTDYVRRRLQPADE